MKIFLSAICLMLAGFCPPAGAASQQMNAGILRLTPVDTNPAPDTLVWYPTEMREPTWRIGPFPVPASHNAQIADGRFPVILISHGGGPTGGTPLMLMALSAALARQGFIVIAPFHARTPLQDRPAQIVAALQAAAADARLQTHMDGSRLGMLGFSLGAAVTLELAGAVPNPANYVSYCTSNPGDRMSCAHAPDGHIPETDGQAAPAQAAPPRLPLTAIVLLDPFAVLFRERELADISASVLILRPQNSQLPGQANADELRTGLPHAPQFRVIPGNHFIFTDVCPPELLAKAEEMCRDPDGVKRTSVHHSISAQISAFFRAHW